MRKKIIAAAIAVALVASPLFAIFGIGDIVYDPISYANAVLMLAELVKSYAELKAEYDLFVQEFRMIPVDMLTRYRTLGASWYGLQLPADRFNNLGSWLQTVNQGGSALGAYNAASVALRQYGPEVGQLSAEEQTKTASQYASIELADATNVQTMETVGMLRANASAVDRAIQNLEADSLSSDPALNTEVGVLNKINATAIAQLRSERDANRALLSTLEQQVAEAKHRRDSEVTEINTQISRLQQGAAEKAKYTGTITQSIQSFRWH
jgi:type IV secretion system protein TrbJ